MIIGRFSASLTSPNILPIYKRGSLGCIKDYRLINKISPIFKVLKSNVSDAIHNHLSTKNLLSHAQHGFQKSRFRSSCQLDSLYHIQAT